MQPAARRDADVIVVGAGPAGSAAALPPGPAGLRRAAAGEDRFPREKVCGDGLTPRAVKQLVALGIDISEAGWIRNKGLRVIGGGLRLELEWPELASFPDLRPGPARGCDFDQMLARPRAPKAGAELRTAPPSPARARRATGRVVGVTAEGTGGRRRAPTVRRSSSPPTGSPRRFALALGLDRRDDRPMGVAVRSYFRTPAPRRRLAGVAGWSCADGGPGERTCCPGTAGSSALGDGTANVGLGVAQHARRDQGRLPDVAPGGWRTRRRSGSSRRDNAVGPVRGAALPMGFNRAPHYAHGLMLVGDAGGMVNPFNGEGIAYAMESGELAADGSRPGAGPGAGPSGSGHCRPTRRR